jgi:Zn finger protein HypA/HybF involved in hydrogenase expression
MPTVRKTFATYAEIDFQLWCATCGNRICGNTTYRRNSDNHFDTYCDRCQKERDALRAERNGLLREVRYLAREILN